MTEGAEITSHRDTETQRTLDQGKLDQRQLDLRKRDLCFSVSLWLAFSVFSAPSVFSPCP
jgi:hypothetical protein